MIERTKVPRGEARERILAAATKLFGAQGYEATTTRQIVEEARVTKGALYHWFGTKDELLTTIYRGLLAEQTSRLAAIAHGGGPVDKRLYAAVADLFDHMNEHYEPLTVWARSMHLVEGEGAAAVRRDRRRYYEIFRDLIKEGQAAGTVRTDVLASVITHTYLSSVIQIHTWFHPGDPLTRIELGRQMTALFMAGIRPEPEGEA
ncbi:TetR/AcrR family transcriptional regulator [Actinomadura barringtoniae]|uniref:TetR/AcrR family transcriptional regulator n=1 Tax=Actinomadura barringtoniae TaxID=1427535 RepID=A0A939PM43_9ACTN|nr:TetR/AcrR family transcriptional regulator [Actinomadura barringtoniae]MBO2455457.1 TetR/AcrR family transcriptional regulator [Actinomadura barringtoniae]